MCSDIRRVEKDKRKRQQQKRQKTTKFHFTEQTPGIFPTVRRITCNLSTQPLQSPKLSGAKTTDGKEQKKNKKRERKKKISRRCTESEAVIISRQDQLVDNLLSFQNNDPHSLPTPRPTPFKNNGPYRGRLSEMTIKTTLHQCGKHAKGLAVFVLGL